MTDLNLKLLVGKLNTTSRDALVAAVNLCALRENYEVELQHFLLKLAETEATDFSRILTHYGVNRERLSRDLTRELERLKRGNTANPALSPRLPALVREAWDFASVDYGAEKVRTGHLMVGLLSNETLARLARDLSAEFGNIQLDSLRKELPRLTADTAEGREARRDAGPSEGAGEPGDEATGGAVAGGALEQYTIDLTARAHAGHIDPVLGRDFEVRQIIDILMRRRQNNPILTGEAGVGKTAVVEGFALRVAGGDVPEPLRNVSVRTLDLGLLQAGAGVKGEFENRLKSVIEEVKTSARPIILFIDEAHAMIGAGGQAGQSDAANLLKPALARGELRTIAATTWAEYKKYFEKDAALARRFQVIKVEEPTEEQAVVMMRGLTTMLEGHHRVRILDEAVTDAVKLSQRYISGRQLPDKAVSVLDTASARVAIGQVATPPAVEDAQRRLEQLAVEIDALTREAATGGDYSARLEELTAARSAEEERLSRLNAQWERERELVARLRAVRAELEARIEPGAPGVPASAEARPAADAGAQGEAVAPDADALRAELGRLNGELREVQGETPLMQPHVNSQTIAEVISGWTGIPVGRMLTDEVNAILSLRERLGQRVVGQAQALEAISRRIRTARASLTDPRRPVGVFLLVGPSGVGKTETALALAETLYGGERSLITINMSEYQESHTVSGLKGSPPGYVGYGEGGVLTEAVRRRPYSVVLLDEAEKAHPDVMELFYQVFDKGVLEDGEGREIDFKNTVILLTANTGAAAITKLSADPDTRPEADALAAALRPELLEVFKPALLGRMVVVPYYPITDDVMREIIRLQLGRVGQRIAQNHRAAFSYEDAVVDAIADRCKEVESGARNVDHVLTGSLLPELSAEFLALVAEGRLPSRVRVAVGEGGQFRYEVS
ncbi:MAG TPA: type VI secretion system ATPase TssH [Pyrinomonadaceae bacterium]